MVGAEHILRSYCSDMYEIAGRRSFSAFCSSRNLEVGSTRFEYHPIDGSFYFYAGLGYFGIKGQYGIQGVNGQLVASRFVTRQSQTFMGLGSFWHLGCGYLTIDWLGFGLPIYQKTRFEGEPQTVSIDFLQTYVRQSEFVCSQVKPLHNDRSHSELCECGKSA